MKIIKSRILGKIRSLNYNNTHTIKELKPKVNRYGYLEVKLSKNNKTKNYLVSTLVAQAFLKNINPDKEVMHLDDVTDNSIKNLKYGYRSELLHLTYKRGRRLGKPTKNTISYKGIQAVNLSQLAKKYNVEPHRVLKRISRGWTLEEALEIPLKREKFRLNITLYKYKGELLSVKQLAEKYNISKNNIYKRLNRGWSLEESIEIPLAKRKDMNINENEL